MLPFEFYESLFKNMQCLSALQYLFANKNLLC
jgi:hypothetical protein